MSPDLSSQKGNVHDDEGVIIRDPLEILCDKHGGECYRERRGNKSHSSESVTPVGNLSQSGKYQDRVEGPRVKRWRLLQKLYWLIAKRNFKKR